MKNLRKRFPVLVSIGLALLFLAVNYLLSKPLERIADTVAQHLYLFQLIMELVVFAIFLGLAVLMGMQFIFRRSRKPLGERILPCAAILVLYTLALLGGITLCLEDPLQPPLKILSFVLCMLSVGLTEELIFRGLITRILYAKYGKNPVGVWLSVLLSSLLFGLIHLSNAIGGVELGSVLIQVVGASALGICLSAIYLRTGSFWTVVLLHAYMDFCGLVSSGVFVSDSLADLLGGYSSGSLIAAAVYAALGIFLLRRSKMKTITDLSAEPPQGQIIGLMITVLLLVGVASAVAVFTF